MPDPARTRPRSPAFMKHVDHLRLWRIVEGAVANAFREHPAYLTDSGRRSAVESVTKRVVGDLVGHAKQLRKQASLGMHPPVAATNGDTGSPFRAEGSGEDVPSSCAGREGVEPSRLTYSEGKVR